jgi:uncharacterized protein (DUF427 family)
MVDSQPLLDYFVSLGGLRHKAKEVSMWQAVWNGGVIATSDQTVEVEGNQYFPMDSINKELITDSTQTSVCPWKGEANYFNVVVNGEINPDAAWIYRTPKERASQIAGHVAFWRGVEVTKIA